MISATIDARIDLQSPQSHGTEAPFRPSKVSSFYGSHIAPSQLTLRGSESKRVQSRVSTDVIHSNSNSRGRGMRARRDYEIFREEERREIIASCPELMSDFNQGVFRSAAKAMFSALDDETKLVYRVKAAKEREAVASMMGLKKETKKTTAVQGGRRRRRKRSKGGSRQESTVVVKLKEEHGTRTSPRLVAMKTTATKT